MFAVTASSESYFEQQIKCHVRFPTAVPCTCLFHHFQDMTSPTGCFSLYPAKVYPARTRASGSSNYKQERRELMHLQHWQLSSVCHFHLILQKMGEKKKANGQWKNKLQCQKGGLFFFLLITCKLTFISLHQKQNKTKKQPHTSGRKLEYQSSWKTTSDQLINGNQAHT